jgi:DNA-binding transcriptional ArsR family regulator
MAKIIRSLLQVKALSHPLRLRILETLSGSARTPKQVAELLGRKPTGLYHHFRVLESARLIRRAGTRRKRGTIETFYRAVSPEVRVDPRVFGRRRSRVPAVLTGVLDAAGDEVRSLPAPTAPVLALRFRARLSPARVRELRRILERWARSADISGAPLYAIAAVVYPAPHGRKERE